LDAVRLPAALREWLSPLDVIKIRFQVMSELPGVYNRRHYASMSSAARSIFKDGGPAAFWKGNCAAMLMVVPYGSIQFASFYQFQQSGLVAPLKEPYRSLVVGSAAGALATILTYPLDLLRTRFAAQTEGRRVYSSLRQARREILAREGLAGFLAGLRPTLVEIVPYAGIQFASYEWAKTRFVENNSVGNSISKLQTFGAACFAGLTSKLFTLPLDVVRKKLQVQAQFPGFRDAPMFTGVVDTIATVFRRDGLRGLFRGFTPSLLKAVPNAGLTFIVYEEARAYVLVRRQSMR
jgi:solute carrier family 25 (mitochondrial thiamine pyrophosphate transporter), member 19